MQRVFLICLTFLTTILLSLPSVAQEAFVPEGLYFQGEVIRKVSVGHNAVWVVKGQDSTGVGKVDLQGIEYDYTTSINTSVPLAGIVGKYGDSAMIASTSNYLLQFDKGVITRIDKDLGVKGNRITDITGNESFTFIATDSGYQKSYNNASFVTMRFVDPKPPVLRIFHNERKGLSAYAYQEQVGSCSEWPNSNTLKIIVQRAYANQVNSALFNPDEISGLNAIAVADEYIHSYSPTYIATFFIGNTSGLKVGLGDCKSIVKTFLQDTTVYAIKNYKSSMLIGSEKGLFYCSEKDPDMMYSVQLGGAYKIYDISVDEDKDLVWLATDQGLYKLHGDSYQTPPPAKTIEDIEWTRHIGGSFSDLVKAMVTDAYGNVYMTGSFSGMAKFGDSVLIAKNQQDYFLVKYNASGDMLWVRSATRLKETGYPSVGCGLALTVDHLENVYVLTTHYIDYEEQPIIGPDFGYGVKAADPAAKNSYLVKYDVNGTPQWTQPTAMSYHTNTSSYFSGHPQLNSDKNGNIYLASAANFTNPDYHVKFAVWKYNPDFKLEWLKKFPLQFTTITLKPGGEFYLYGKFGLFRDTLVVDTIKLSREDDDSFALVHLDSSGKAKWGKAFGNSHSHVENLTGLGFDDFGNTYISGSYSVDMQLGEWVHTNRKHDYGIFHAKLNASGAFSWVRFGETKEHLPNNQILVDSLGFSILTGKFEKSLTLNNLTLEASSDQEEVYLIKYDPSGNLSWGYAIPGLTYDLYSIKTIAKGPKNSFYIGGELINNINLNNSLLAVKGVSDIFLARITDPTSIFSINVIRGKSFFDKDKNGAYNEGDEPIADLIVKAEPGPLYTKTDHEGNYVLYLPKGDYTIEQIIPNYKGKIITPIAPEQPFSISLTTAGIDSAGFDFVNDVKVSPFLSVDVTSTRFRRCFTHTTKVEYCNEGFANAENVELVLEYPEFVIPIASSIPWTSRNGNTYTFSIGSMPSQSCRTITFKDSVICGNESIRDLTQCIKGSLRSLNTTVNPDPEWDRSDIVLSAECRDNGFVRVGIHNSGTGHMADSASFSIFLNQQQVYGGKYKLKAGEDLSLNLLANGKPLHLEAKLTPHHPDKRAVSITIQGCNSNGEGIIDGGYVNQFPQNDEAETIELVCLPIIDSYDPNDKQVAPAGITSTNNIAEDSMLEYTIRFQNTGTDTAYTVVVVDPLSEHLDISTLKVGLSSHPVKWEFSQDNQPSIVWRFPKINLPDSTTNERASHGFVKFKIRPKPDLPLGTVISNKAEIYFDYNSPIITNEVFNTIGLPELVPGEKVLVQNCNTKINLLQEENLAIVLCSDARSYQLSRQVPVDGRGNWKVTKGNAFLQDPHSHQTLASNISFGENEFSWELTYCDHIVISKVTIIRELPLEKPQITPPAPICQGEVYPAIGTTGEGVEWYRDAALTKLALKGNTYQASGQQSETLYVIRRSPTCSSPVAVVQVVVQPQPSPPVAYAAEACVELKQPLLTAQGSNLRWYADATKQQLLAEGESFSPADKSSRSYWLTQSSEYCESQPVEVRFTAKHFDPAKAYIANVVTPNGDDKNQLYYVKDFEGKECMGEFISIRIYNRWGRQVYESKAADFKWDASQLPTGVYYYRMDYQLNKFQGSIQVLR
ncbi:hypothetical protein D770_08780 [Flammeovirgaceae bacterium 311]|nr:hypothetical protein D770_08780 [Flammeovirgaceae bacterium 311]